MWRWLFILAGCGRINFEPLSTDSGSGSSDAHQLTYRDVVLADTPLAYWRLNDRDSVARDVMGTASGAYQGTCTYDSAAALTDDPDRAVDFAGTCYVTAGDVLAFPGRAPFSLETWVELDNAAQGPILILKETRSAPLYGPDDGYALVVNSSGAYVERVVATDVTISSFAPVSGPGFHHVVGTYDGMELTIYVDGVFGARGTDTRPMQTYSAPVMLGGFAPPPTGLVEGSLDEVAIYGHALSPQRIALHYDIGVTGPR